MAIYSEFSHQKWWFSIATLNYQRVLYPSTCVTLEIHTASLTLAAASPQLHFQTLETSRAKSRNSLVEDSDYERWLLNVVLFKAEKLLWEFSSTRSFQSCGVPSSKGVEPPRGWPSRVTNPNGLGLGFVYRNSSLGVLEIYRRSSMSMENSKDQKIKNHH